MMRKTVLRGAFLLVAFGGLVALPLAFAASDKGTQRSDCPGKVVCPLTGEEVCKDQCPVGVGTAATVTAAADTADDPPPCCRKAKK